MKALSQARPSSIATTKQQAVRLVERTSICQVSPAAFYLVAEAMLILQLGLDEYREALTPRVGSMRVCVCLHAGLEYPSGRLKLDAATSMLRVHHIDADDGCNEVGCNIDRIVDNPDGRAAWQPDGEVLLCPQLEPEPEPQPEPEPEPEP